MQSNNSNNSKNFKRKNNKNKRVLNRAKLFLSYDALKGFKERIHEKERIIVEKPILSDDQLYELDWKIHQVKQGMMVDVIYFEKDIKNNGFYIYKKGMVANIDLDNKKEIQIVDKRIKIKNILSIESIEFS